MALKSRLGRKFKSTNSDRNSDRTQSLMQFARVNLVALSTLGPDYPNARRPLPKGLLGVALSFAFYSVSAYLKIVKL